MDEDGKRIRGQDNRQAAELALARVKVADRWHPTPEPASKGEWLVARVCSQYIEHCQRGVASGAISEGYRDDAVRYLNSLCGYCGRTAHQPTQEGGTSGIGSRPTRPGGRRPRSATRSPSSWRRSTMLSRVHDVPSPLKGLKKPPSRPRLHSFSGKEEEALYAATDEPFRDFLFAAIHTGLRPFCELARLAADNVEDTERGMMWRVFSSKTKKTRKIPVRSGVAELTRRLMETAPLGSAVPTVSQHAGESLEEGHGRRPVPEDQDEGRLGSGTRSGRTTRHTPAGTPLPIACSQGTGTAGWAVRSRRWRN